MDSRDLKLPSVQVLVRKLLLLAQIDVKLAVLTHLCYDMKSQERVGLELTSSAPFRSTTAQVR